MDHDHLKSTTTREGDKSILGPWFLGGLRNRRVNEALDRWLADGPAPRAALRPEYVPEREGRPFGGRS